MDFHTLDVFTDRMFGGNQLAVFPDAPELPTEVMQAIAREFNFSETVFVRPTQMAGALRKLRIFTPGGELPFAGHPTIGTAQLLVELGIADATGGNFGLEENVGLIPVEVAQAADGMFFTWLKTARLPESRENVPTCEILTAMLGLDRGDILDGERDAPMAWSAGVPYLCVPVRDRVVLGRVIVDVALWREALKDAWARDIFVFCQEPAGEEVNLRARMFGPAVGITEDPATGSAVAALAGYLWRRERRAGRWIIAQGVEMGRPSTIHLEIRDADGEIGAVRVGGSAVRVSHGTFDLRS